MLKTSFRYLLGGRHVEGFIFIPILDSIDGEIGLNAERETVQEFSTVIGKCGGKMQLLIFVIFWVKKGKKFFVFLRGGI